MVAQLAAGVSISSIVSTSRGVERANKARAKLIASFHKASLEAIALQRAAAEAQIAAGWATASQKFGLAAPIALAQGFFAATAILTTVSACTAGTLVTFGLACYAAGAATSAGFTGVDLFLEGNKQAILNSADPLSTTVDLMQDPFAWANGMLGGPPSGIAG